MFTKIENALVNGLPFCAYRKPKSESLVGVFQKDSELHFTHDFSEKGFVFAPFSKDKNAVLIQPDEVLNSNFKADQKQIVSNDRVSDKGKVNHLELVKSGIHQIKMGSLKKVVLSRKIEVETTKSPLDLFQNLLVQYPNAFCYLFHHPKVGMWCGATPETLIGIYHGELHTMALAATLPYLVNEEPKWGAKELEEQLMVSDFIADNLKGLMENLEIGNVESVKAGNLWHLRSDVKGTIAKGVSLSKILEALHPTPAVCGVPVALARDFIMQNENYTRTFYTGFLGELNLNSEGASEFFVNLRCMELAGDKAHIFVGGGITEASDPQSEWQETQNKSRTMLNIL